MTLRYIGKAARKNAQVCRHDMTRQRRIRHPCTTAGCGMNALSVLQNRLFRQNPSRTQKMILPERFSQPTYPNGFPRAR